MPINSYSCRTCNYKIVESNRNTISGKQTQYNIVIPYQSGPPLVITFAPCTVRLGFAMRQIENYTSDSSRLCESTAFNHSDQLFITFKEN